MLCYTAVQPEDRMMRIYIAIIIGVGAGILLTAVICFAIYFHSKAKR